MLGAKASVFLPLILWSFPTEAVNVKRHDGVHRMTKKPQITRAAVLQGKRDDVCGTQMKLCPASLGGECCPENYACATNSCYATTRSPGTCGSLVGWHACDNLFGGGCCPDGFTCQTGGKCVPPAVTSSSYSCPSDQFLCPSALGYGCCPNGMGCGIYECYSTQPTTQTTTMTFTTTENGKKATITTTATTVMSPSAPTAASTVLAEVQDDGNHVTYKYYPSSMPQTLPLVNQTGSNGGGSSDNGGKSSGLTTAQLGGIIGGAIAFLLLVVAASCIFIRRLNKLAKRVEASKRAGSSKPSAKEKTQRSVTVTESEVFEPPTNQGTPLSHLSPVSPEPQGRQDSVSEIQRSHSRQQSGGNMTVSSISSGEPHTAGDQFARIGPDGPGRTSGQYDMGRSHHRQGSGQSATRISTSSWQSVSGTSDVSNDRRTTAELEASLYVPELVGSPPPPEWLNEQQDALTGDHPREGKRPPLANQWMRSVSMLRRTESLATGRLDVVDEEWHGFYGPRDYMAGQTRAGNPPRNDGETNQRRG